jgi:hypothetical protein
MTARWLAPLAVVLPDPGNLATAGLASMAGMCAGVAIGHLRNLPQERISDLARDGACVGFGVASTAWLVQLAIDLL